MSSAIRFKDYNEKCDLILKNIEGDLKKVSYRNSSIVMSGEQEFVLTPLFESESYLINYNIITTKLITPTTLIKKNNIEFKLYPVIDGLTIKEVYRYFDEIILDNVNPKTFFIIVFDNDVPKFYIKDERIPLDDWLNFGVSFEENKLQVFLNGFITKYVFDFNTNKMVPINLEYALDSSRFILLKNHYGLVSTIELNTFSDDIVTLTETDFMDYAYTDYYTVRKCDSRCLSATPVMFPELNNEIIYKPRKYSFDDENVCTFETNNIDPVTGKKAEYCSKTCLAKINCDYPTETDFKDKIIQSTHYKTEFSLNENPLSETCIIDKDTCDLVYTSFELVRPVTRVANYTEYLKLETDFSGQLKTLYKDNWKVNWASRLTAWKDVVDGAAVLNIGDEVFSDSASEWIIEHNLDTYDVICHSFGTNNEMIYPDKQYPIDENHYMVSWGKASVGGFSLIKAAVLVNTFDQLQDRPFVIVHNLHDLSEPDLVQMRNEDENKEREEPKEFIEDGKKIIVELTKKFNSSATILINAADKMFYFKEPSYEWNIQHDMGALGIHPQIYNEEFELIQPKEVFLLDKNNMKITFDVPMSGYVGLKKIGDPYWKNGIIEKIIEKDDNGNFKGKFAIGDLSGIQFDKNYGDKFFRLNEKKRMQSDTPIFIPISSFQEKKDTYTFEFIINPSDFVDLNINEIGLFDKNNQLCFYSCGDNIYYPTQFSFKHRFVIHKEDIKGA